MSEESRSGVRLFRRLTLAACLLGILPNAYSQVATQPATQQIIKTPELSPEVRLNPGKGWVLYGLGPWLYSPELLSLGSVGYDLNEWAYIEPQPGVYDWKWFDDHIKVWGDAGKQFAFGIECANSNATHASAVPQWVYDMGAKSYTSKSSSGLTQTIPKWDDPIFLRELGKMAKAIGERYDGNPNIAYIDIRSYGNWGEGHLWGIGGTRIAPQVLKQHILNYKNAFPHTRLVLPYGEGTFNPVYDWAVDQGISIRRDGICGNSDGKELIRCIGKAPAVFEFYHAYEELKQSGWWDGKKTPDGNGHTLMECVNNGHPSYICLSTTPTSAAIFVKEQSPLIHQLANSMGYDFAVRRVSFPNIWRPGASERITMTVENIGMTPIFEPAIPAFALLDDAGRSVERAWVKPEQSNPRRWRPGKPSTDLIDVTFSTAPLGHYRLALGMFTDISQPSPAYLFANKGATADRWLVLDDIRVANP